jgi:hypothetical protein
MSTLADALSTHEVRPFVNVNGNATDSDTGSGSSGSSRSSGSYSGSGSDLQSLGGTPVMTPMPAMEQLGRRVSVGSVDGNAMFGGDVLHVSHTDDSGDDADNHRSSNRGGRNQQLSRRQNNRY